MICRYLENETAQPDCETNIVTRGECRKEGRGDGVGREDGERDERDPGCLCKEGDCEARGLLELVSSKLMWDGGYVGFDFFESRVCACLDVALEEEATHCWC